MRRIQGYHGNRWRRSCCNAVMEQVFHADKANAGRMPESARDFQWRALSLFADIAVDLL